MVKLAETGRGDRHGLERLARGPGHGAPDLRRERRPVAGSFPRRGDARRHHRGRDRSGGGMIGLGARGLHAGGSSAPSACSRTRCDRQPCGARRLSGAEQRRARLAADHVQLHPGPRADVRHYHRRHRSIGRFAGLAHRRRRRALCQLRALQRLSADRRDAVVCLAVGAAAGWVNALPVVKLEPSAVHHDARDAEMALGAAFILSHGRPIALHEHGFQNTGIGIVFRPLTNALHLPSIPIPVSGCSS